MFLFRFLSSPGVRPVAVLFFSILSSTFFSLRSPPSLFILLSRKRRKSKQNKKTKRKGKRIGTVTRSEWRQARRWRERERKKPQKKEEMHKKSKIEKPEGKRGEIKECPRSKNGDGSGDMEGQDREDEVKAKEPTWKEKPEKTECDQQEVMTQREAGDRKKWNREKKRGPRGRERGFEEEKDCETKQANEREYDEEKIR